MASIASTRAPATVPPMVRAHHNASTGPTAAPANATSTAKATTMVVTPARVYGEYYISFTVLFFVAFCGAMIGMLISTVSKTRLQANQMFLIVFIYQVVADNLAGYHVRGVLRAHERRVLLQENRGIGKEQEDRFKEHGA